MGYVIIKDRNNRELELESNNAIPVNIQDQHTEIIDLKFSRTLDVITLQDNYAVGDQTIRVETTGVTPLTNHTVCLKEDSAFYQSLIISVTPVAGNIYDLLLDSPLDYTYTTSGGCALTSTNLAVDGSVTPVIFKVSPVGLSTGIEWDITRLLILFGGEGVGVADDAPDDGDFGVTTALTNGIVLRVKNGIYKNIFNAKTNGDFRARAYDVTYTPATRGGVYSVATRRTFAGQNKNGVTVRLVADDADEFQLIVQDDLTEMLGGQAIVQGHVVTD